LYFQDISDNLFRYTEILMPFSPFTEFEHCRTE